MNQAQLVIQWDKQTGHLAIIPQNMTEAEVLVILKDAADTFGQHILEAAKKGSGIVIAPAMPKVKGD